ncbi:helix-turn-helix transcriptional regulator [Ottowia sp. VDI28]|uniref:helix-turn-helix transcriptional regulator n=1 Tax=Ottowia sp. VDI28 TaxID=3133968 RepID=UPI003C2D3696
MVQTMWRGDNWENVAGLLYDGITSHDDWYAGLDAIRQAMGGVFFHHLRMRLDDFTMFDSLANLTASADKVREYEQEHIHNDIRMNIGISAPAGSVVFDHEYFDARVLSRNAVYADWLPSIGVRHTLVMKLSADDGVIDTVGVMRDKTDAPYGAHERRVCERLMPHLTRASKLRSRTAGLASQAALGMAALDAMPSALALVDEGGRVRFLNTAARLTLASGDPWYIHHDRLYASDPLAQETLVRYIAVACRRQGTPLAGSVRLGRNLLHVLPLQPTHPLAQVHDEIPHALLVWASPDMALGTNHIATALGLTETEARLALMLAQGQSIKDFAQTQDCTVNTARTHVRNLLAKTGCHRQAEVSQMVRGLI